MQQRRDIGNELIVAVIAVGVLAFALIFGIVISLSNSANLPSTPTAVVVVATELPPTTAAPEASATSEATLESASPTAEAPTAVPATNTAESPTATNTDVPATNTVEPPTATYTDVPTSTPTETPKPPTATNTPVPPTATFTATEPPPPATNTSEPTFVQAQVETETPTSAPPTATFTATASPEPPTATNTATSEPTATNTPVPPTATFTATELPPTATNTPVPPTATFTPTESPPTATNTATATNTPVPPTATFTPTVTFTATATLEPTETPAPRNTVVPTDDFVLPTAIVLGSELELPSIDELLTPIPVIPECSLPPGWTMYTVQRGDNLYAIAQAVGSSVNQLREVNCLENVANLQVNDVLFVPRQPSLPVATLPPVFPQTGVRGVGCTDPNVQIIIPSPGVVVSGLFGIGGTASIPDFQFYRLEVRPDTAQRYSWYSSSTTPVVNGFLGEIDTALFGSGLHWIRLVVVDTAGNSLVPCAIPVIFR